MYGGTSWRNPFNVVARLGRKAFTLSCTGLAHCPMSLSDDDQCCELRSDDGSGSESEAQMEYPHNMGLHRLTLLTVSQE